MGKLESQALEEWRTNYQAEIIEYCRFVDDLWFLFKGSQEELDEFVRFMNRQNPHIKFTVQVDFETKSVPFLDLIVYIDKDGFLQTTLYAKPNVRNGLLK